MTDREFLVHLQTEINQYLGTPVTPPVVEPPIVIIPPSGGGIPPPSPSNFPPMLTSYPPVPVGNYRSAPLKHGEAIFVNLTNEGCSPGMVYEVAFSLMPNDFSHSLGTSISSGGGWFGCRSVYGYTTAVFPVSGQNNGIVFNWSSQIA